MASAPRPSAGGGALPRATNLNRSAATSTASLASTSTSSSVPSVVSTGLRRSPSSTDILNPAADTLKVGDRVYVNGSKPGAIRFMGQTSFAPGTWAGVELDDESGKNDGSVSGVRYFDCPQSHGIFVRPYRLTVDPLSDDSGNGGHAAGTATPMSDRTTSSDASQQQRTEPSAKVTKSNSGTTVCGNLRVGQRVTVNASSGMKVGTLRYLGPTDFATGAWAGVELDVAVGKNDGSVAGKCFVVVVAVVVAILETCCVMLCVFLCCCLIDRQTLL